MTDIHIAFQKLDSRAIPPTYATKDAAGADLYALLDAELVIAPGQTCLIPTGIALEIPQGYAGFIYARSGLATRCGLAPANKVGVIDADYRGEVMVALHNHADRPATLQSGERVAQIVFAPVAHACLSQVEDLTDTARGEGGFGSTGK